MASPPIGGSGHTNSDWNVEKTKNKTEQKTKNSSHFLRWPIEDMSHFVFFFLLLLLLLIAQ